MNGKELVYTFREQYYEPGSEHQVTVAGDPVGKLESATLRWEYRTNPLNPLTWRFIATPRIYIGWMQIENIQEGDRYVLLSIIISVCFPVAFHLGCIIPLVLL
jgi:hypothetical protein